MDPTSAVPLAPGPTANYVHHCLERDGNKVSVWFNDGSIVLQAQQNLFRVYSGVLVNQSPVFKDMFTFPQPSGEPSYDGCPLVVMQDDPLDLCYFLKALHDYTYMSKRLAQLDVLAAVLRLSTKYEITEMRQIALEAFNKRYPSQLSNWDHRAHFDFFPGVHIAAANLALEMGIEPALPAIFYSLRLVYGHDCSVPLSHAGVTLNPEGMRRYISGLPTVLVKETHTWYSLLGRLLPTCQNPEECLPARLAEVGSMSIEARFFSVLREEHLNWPAFQRAVCNSCNADAQARFTIHRGIFWEALPSIFTSED